MGSVSYEIPVPHRDRDQTLLDAIDDLRQAPLSPAERNVAREVLINAALQQGEHTIGELCDRLEAASPAERRAVLDRARDQLGLEPVETVIAREKFEAGNRALKPGRDARGRSVQQCPADGCGRVSVGPSGIPEPGRRSAVVVQRTSSPRRPRRPPAARGPRAAVGRGDNVAQAEPG